MTLLNKARLVVREAYADGNWHSPWVQDRLRGLPGVGYARASSLMDRLVADGTLEQRRAEGASQGRGGNEYRLASLPASQPKEGHSE